MLTLLIIDGNQRTTTKTKIQRATFVHLFWGRGVSSPVTRSNYRGELLCRDSSAKVLVQIITRKKWKLW